MVGNILIGKVGEYIKVSMGERSVSQFNIYFLYLIYTNPSSDPDRAYQSLVEEINLLEREPQWVPGSWLKQDKGFY